MITKGILRSLTKKDVKKDGKSFSFLDITADVFFDKKVKSLKGSMNYDTAKDYFIYINEMLGTKSKDYIGKEIGVTTYKEGFKNDKGEYIVVDKIKRIYIIDEDGNNIYKPIEEEESDLLF